MQRHSLQSFNLAVLPQKKAIDITTAISIKENSLKIPGHLIDSLGTMENDSNNISVPGLVLKVILN